MYFVFYSSCITENIVFSHLFRQYSLPFFIIPLIDTGRHLLWLPASPRTSDDLSNHRGRSQRAQGIQPQLDCVAHYKSNMISSRFPYKVTKWKLSSDFNSHIATNWSINCRLEAGIFEGNCSSWCLNLRNYSICLLVLLYVNVLIQLLAHAALPDWLKDNDFLHSSHRPPIPCIATCFKSVFSLHSETVNIWTHLIGSLILVGITFWFFVRPSNVPYTWQKVVVSSFLVFIMSLAQICFFFAVTEMILVSSVFIGTLRRHCYSNV